MEGLSRELFVSENLKEQSKSFEEMYLIRDIDIDIVLQQGSK